MPWCPKCKNEYRQGIKMCADCHVELVEKEELTSQVFLCGGQSEDMYSLKEYLEYNKFKNVNVKLDDKKGIYEVYVDEKDLSSVETLTRVFMEQQMLQKKQAQMAAQQQMFAAQAAMSEAAKNANAAAQSGNGGRRGAYQGGYVFGMGYQGVQAPEKDNTEDTPSGSWSAQASVFQMPDFQQTAVHVEGGEQEKASKKSEKSDSQKTAASHTSGAETATPWQTVEPSMSQTSTALQNGQAPTNSSEQPINAPQPQAVRRSTSGRFVDSADRAEDNRSSAWTLLIVGGLGIIVMVLGIAGVLPFNVGNPYLFYGVMSAVFILFLVMGVVSFKNAKLFDEKAESENSLRDTLLQWSEENLTAEKVDMQLRMVGLGDNDDEELYFKRYEMLKYMLNHQFMNLDQAFLEKLIDDTVYDMVFGEDV